MSRRVLIAVLALSLVVSCTLPSLPGFSTNMPQSLRDAAPAPTTVPLPANTQPVVGEGIRPPHPINLPPGFTISVYAEGLGSPRGIAVAPDRTIVVGDIKHDRIIDISTTAASGLAAPRILLDSLAEPHSVTFYDGHLYIGDTDKVLRLEHKSGAVQGRPTTIVSDLPTGGDHTTRTVLFGTDGHLYVSIGSSCNICIERDPRRAVVMVFDADGSHGRVYASGLRNAVGMTVRPNTNEIWMTNNGRDLLGDEQPPETIYQLREGGNYGWPRCHSGRLIDPKFGQAGDCDGVIPPLVEMQAHSAPLGLSFYTGTQFPAEYRGNLFVAFHGSWNRSQPTGYKVVRIPIDRDGRPGPVQDFATGFRTDDGDVWARPVDIATAPDGSLLITDDKGGRVFRISYSGQ